MAVNTLTAMHWWILVPSSLLLVGVITFALRRLLLRLAGPHRSEVARYAAPLMPALGVLFAFLSGFAITSAWNAGSNAEMAVSRESVAAGALAWASTAPGADTAAIQRALDDYLDAVLGAEWTEISSVTPAVDPAGVQQQVLQQVVRTSASDPRMSSADASSMLAHLDDLVSSRATRLAVASQSMPLPLFLALVITGLAVCLNAVAVSLDGDHRSRLVTTSVVVVVAIDLAVLLILSGPFVGSQRVSDAPLVAVQSQLDSGQFVR